MVLLVFSTNPPFVRALCLHRGWHFEPCPERLEESLPYCAPSSRVRQPSSEHPRPCCLSLQKYNRDLGHCISELLSCRPPFEGKRDTRILGLSLPRSQHFPRWAQ